MARKKNKKSGKKSTFRHSLRSQLSSLSSTSEPTESETAADEREWAAWERERSKTTPLFSKEPDSLSSDSLQRELDAALRANERLSKENQQLIQQQRTLRSSKVELERGLRQTQDRLLTLRMEHKEALAVQTRTSHSETPTSRMVTLKEWWDSCGLESDVQHQLMLDLLSEAPDEFLRWVSVSELDAQTWQKERVRRVCREELCQLAWREQRRILITVSQSRDCEFCAGSDNRREFHTLLSLLRTLRLYKVVVVGGSPDTHKEIHSLLPKKHQWKLVEGSVSRNKRQATQDLRSSDLVILWGATILPHKISELYTDQREEFPEKIKAVHKRGVAGFSRELRAALERQDQ